MIPMKFFDASFAMRKYFPYKDFLNQQIGLLKSSGVIDHILKRNKPKEPSCPLKEKTISIHFEKVIFPFAVYALGALVSLVILMIENLKHRQNREIESRLDEQSKIQPTNTMNAAVQCNLIQKCTLLCNPN